MSDTIAERCERLRQPVIDLLSVGMTATTAPNELPRLTAQIGVVRSIIDDDVSGIDSTGYLEWRPVALQTLRLMEEAARRGDADESFRLFRDPETGFNRLGQACIGNPGW